MNIKANIKNNFPGLAYVIPFIKKYKYGEYGKAKIVKKGLSALLSTTAYRGNNGSTADAWIKLFNNVEISKDAQSKFIYFIDESKTVAIKGQKLSNFCIDYQRILDQGFESIAKKAFSDDDFGQEAKNILTSLQNFCERIIEHINSSNYEDKDKLCNYFQNMLTKKAEHFDEALQRILFFNQIMWQTGHRLNGLGRLDKTLDKYYKADIDSGYIKKDEAKDLVFDFLNQLTRYYNFKSDTLVGDIGQIIIIGGKLDEEMYFYNDLTFIFLEQQAKLNKPDPKILLRASKLMPDKLLKAAIECLKHSTGSPLFSNDDVVIDALIDSGIDNADAYNYCTSACWEPFIVGKSSDQNNIASYDFFKFFNEVCQGNYKSFEEFLNTYLKSCQDGLVDVGKSLDNLKWAKDPFVSLLTDNCTNIRTDISAGGSKYNNYGITTVAISNIVNSLLAIKKLCFNEKKYTFKQLNEARLKNYEGYAQELQDIKDNSVFFGIDEAEQIDLTNKITKSLSDTCKKFINKYGGKIKFGLSSPSYIMDSKNSQADFSGKLKGQPYHTHISCDVAAPTEVINFANKLEYKGFRHNGNVVDMVLTPQFIENNEEKFLMFVKQTISSGVFQMQFNIFDSKTLIDAKAHPEKYPNLIVRVWGFSAYFNDLPESYKDLMIQRALDKESVAA